jgi:HNH endonuclease/AP2 domain
MQHDPSLVGVGWIPLRNRAGEVVAWTAVDEVDYPHISQWRWFRKVTRGCEYAVRNRPRAERRITGRTASIKMHRILMGLPDGDPREVDHENRDGLDNRRSNLRVVTHAQNQQNMPAFAGGTSAYRGVSYDRQRGLWKAQARRDGKNRLIGRYAKETEARDAAIAFRREHMTHSGD